LSGLAIFVRLRNNKATILAKSVICFKAKGINMNLHEYQAKALFRSYQLPVPNGEVAYSASEAVRVFKNLSTSKCVAKAQVHAGGRGKAGGVKLFSDENELSDFVHSIIGTRLVTYQTDENGQPVNAVLVEETSDIDRELYLGAVIDRASRRVVIMASTEGGVEIEKVAEETPEKIFKVTVDPLVGVMPYQGREVAFKLGLSGNQVKQFTNIMVQLGKMFVDCDLSLLEINPLVVTKSGDVVCLDGKVAVDGNALYRQKNLREMHDSSQEDERERRAGEWELNYIPLDGTIGCMVNGAGLAMATMDVIKLHGGEPANFLDVGGGATKERVSEALKIILSDDKVKGILVNIFGGIVRCDLIAEGILEAVKEVSVTVPVVVRLEGNNAKAGAEILNASDLNVIAASDLTDAAKKIVEAVQ
jgi:succinyl-CoA synthetase beta subunit